MDNNGNNGNGNAPFVDPQPTLVHDRPDYLGAQIEFVDLDIILPPPSRAIRINGRILYVKSSRAQSVEAFMRAAQAQIDEIQYMAKETEDAAFDRRADRILTMLEIPEGVAPVTKDELRAMNTLAFFALVRFIEKEPSLSAEADAALRQRPRIGQPAPVVSN